MRKEDLSAEQQKLLNTNFGPELEKIAAEQAKIAQEMYAKGQDIALNIADAMDKEAAEKVASENQSQALEDAQAEKTAAQMGAFIERGQFDGLRKLGSERHGNEWHYIYPFVEEKVAAAGASAAMGKFRNFMASKAKQVGKDVTKAVKANPGKAMGAAAAGGAAAGAAGGYAAGKK